MKNIDLARPRDEAHVKVIVLGDTVAEKDPHQQKGSVLGLGQAGHAITVGVVHHRSGHIQGNHDIDTGNASRHFSRRGDIDVVYADHV